MPATIGAAPLVPFHRTSPPSAETPTRSSLGAETPIVMPCVEASRLAPTLRVDAGDGQDARDRGGGADAGRAAPPVAGRDHHDDVVIEGVEERVVPALVPVGGVGGQRQVDDVGAVVDRPSDGLGDLIGEGLGGAGAEADRDGEQLGLGRDADHPRSGAGPARGGERGHPAAVVRVDGADRRASVRRALARDIRPADDRALELDRVASDPRVDDRDAHARAARGLPRRADAVLVEPVLGRADGILGRLLRGRMPRPAAARRRVAGRGHRPRAPTRMPTRATPSDAPTRRFTPRSPVLRRRSARATTSTCASARSPMGFTPGPAARAWAARACRHLTRVGMPPAEIPSISGTSPNCARSRRYASWAAA